ncbi:MAG: sigma-E factor negative regulatory protein [Xanthomonadales bacterium]|nr:sigma-E factor negative regulatory protein [Xanthomonadales bacterium]
MSKESLEHLSSLMDGELSREAGLFLTRRLFSDEAMCEKWERYHLVRDCIRQPGSKQVVTGLNVRMSSSLDAEEVPTVSVWRKNRWLKPVSGLAIAASVALMAIVVTAPQPGQIPGEADTVLAAPPSQPFVSPNALARSPASQAVSYASGQQASSNRLNAYLLRHNQMARTAGRQGFVSFVPIVATPVNSVVEDSKDKPESDETGSRLETAENK